MTALAVAAMTDSAKGGTTATQTGRTADEHHARAHQRAGTDETETGRGTGRGTGRWCHSESDR